MFLRKNHFTITLAINGPKNIHPTVTPTVIKAAIRKNLQILLYKSGPTLNYLIPIISLINPKGLVISKESLPVGSANGGNILGGSLPYPFGFFSASVSGINSNDTKTYPYEIFYPSSSTASG